MMFHEAYRFLFDNLPAQVWFLPDPQTYDRVNNAHARFHGHPPDYFKGRPISDILDPESAEISIAANGTVFKTGQETRTREWVRRHEQPPALLEIYRKPSTDKDGNVAYIVCIAEEITDQWQMASELENFFSINLDLLCIADTGGNFLKVNKAWEELLGYPVEYIQQQRFFDFIHPEDIPETTQAMARLTNHEDVTGFTNRYRCKNGSYRYIEWKSTSKNGLIYAAARDITEHRLLEEELEAKTRRMDNILEGTNIGTWEWRIDSGETVFDERWAGMLGYTLEELSPTTIDTWKKLTHPEDLARCSRLLEQHFAGETAYYEAEFRMRHKSGEWVWILDRGKIITWSQDHAPLVMFGTHAEITKRKKAEAGLVASEENFRTFFETITDMIIIADRRGNITHMNRLASETLGYTEGGIKSLEFLSLYGSKSRNEAAALLAGLSEHERASCILPLQTKGKRFIPVETRFWRGKWNGEDCMFSISKDMSEQEEALQKFNKIFNANPAFMAITKISDNTFVDVNTSFLETLLFTREQVIGKTAEELGLFVHDETRREIRAMLGKNQAVRNIESEIRKGKGETVTCLFSGEIIEARGVQYYLSVMTDISMQKKAEKAAMDANKSKSIFLANMSHELRTPLNGVIGFSDLLLQTGLSDTQLQYAKNIGASAHMLMDIINDILDFSKIEAGKVEIERVKTDVIHVLKNCIDIVRHQATEKKVELLLDIAPNFPRHAWIDPVRVRQILLNLLGNAVKFTQTGEIELKASFTQSGKETGVYAFSVRDTGIGIPKENQERLFKAFSQGDASTTRKFGGTGLGLIISDLLARKMGSRISLKSSVGKGSIFFFDIEARTESTREIYESPDITNCLIIDDNEHARNVLLRILEEWKIETYAAASGEEALKILEKRGPFDIIFTDHEMEGISGTETIRMIRGELGLNKDRQPVILLHTSYAYEEIFKEASALGIHETLLKPCFREDIYSAIQSTIHRSPREPAHQNTAKRTQSLQQDLTILVADDNHLNLTLAKALILQILPNAHILEAENGAKALLSAMEDKPDLIFMDVQMPELDGIAATRAIRLQEGPLKHTPIIALTAGVYAEEKERCLKAGMSGFLAKPIEQEKLEETISSYLEHSALASSAVQKETNQQSAHNSDICHFDAGQFLSKIGNDEQTYHEMLEEALEAFSMNIMALTAAVKTRDMELAAREAHKVRGAALTMEMPGLVQISSRIESDASAGTKGNLDPLTMKLEEEWAVITRIIEELLKPRQS